MNTEKQEGRRQLKSMRCTVQVLDKKAYLLNIFAFKVLGEGEELNGDKFLVSPI